MPRVERTSLAGSPKGIQASLLSGEEGKGLHHHHRRYHHRHHHHHHVDSNQQLDVVNENPPPAFAT
jgi:hypothetical protein